MNILILVQAGSASDEDYELRHVSGELSEWWQGLHGDRDFIEPYLDPRLICVTRFLK